jgi:hypothetical protein
MRVGSIRLAAVAPSRQIFRGLMQTAHEEAGLHTVTTTLVTKATPERSGKSAPDFRPAAAIRFGLPWRIGEPLGANVTLALR